MSSFQDYSKHSFDLSQRLKSLEEQLSELTYNNTKVVQNQFAKNWSTDIQSTLHHGIKIGLCVDTKDPLGRGRVRFYLPGTTKKNTPIKALPWAWPISPLGGFDDSGCLWVPPAGSALVLVFENGDRAAPYYIGTVWNGDRGAPPHNWGYSVQEFFDVYAGHRKGYFAGPNDESQVKPPSNTENYNIKDYDDLQAFEQDTEALRNITPSHIHVLKTAEKHRIKMVDGNPNCHRSGKRFEIGSGCGNTILMYDDHMHAAGFHANPKCCQSGPSASGGEGSGLNCPDESPTCGTHQDSECQNELFKHESECRIFRGPRTPQNNKCDLQQTGMVFSSVSGHIFVMDDEVSDPQGIPEWERGTKPFDFGCEDKFYGKMYMKSATGHLFQMGDAEDQGGVRSGDFTHPVTGSYEPNGIVLKTATGHLIEMNDHTLPGGRAGENRHVKIQSTSNHLFELVDNGNEQQSPNRKEGGTPDAKSKNAYVRLRSGYGLQLLMRDDNSQENEAEKQFIELMAPQKQNDNGPHILRMQEAQPSDPGIVLLRCGGQFVGISTDQWIEIIGTDEQPASKITKVTESDIKITDQLYYRQSETEFHKADKYIILGAGKDCPPADGEDGENGPCIFPVVVVGPTGLMMSDRVFASTSLQAPMCSINQLLPFAPSPEISE